MSSNPGAWDAHLGGLPNPHFLQTHKWGQVKRAYGWHPSYATWDANGHLRVTADPDLGRAIPPVPVAAGLILRRTIRFAGISAPWSILYLPKGPNMAWEDDGLRRQVLSDLEDHAKKSRALFLKMDPEVVLGRGVPGREDNRLDGGAGAVQRDLLDRGWQFSAEQIQFRNTVLIDLSAPEDALLARMRQKTRYNIRLAERKGVRIRTGGEVDFPLLFRMYAETSVRDGFVIRDEGYYHRVWSLFQDRGNDSSSQPYAQSLIAEFEGQPVAAIIVFYFAGRAWYVYGMSRAAHREKMPNHLLQWEAIRRAKAAGCSIYDLWGAPDEFVESDSLWGVFRFKEGLGGEVVRTLGAWDFVPNRFMYNLYANVMPRLLGLMRSRGRARTREAM